MIEIILCILLLSLLLVKIVYQQKEEFHYPQKLFVNGGFGFAYPPGFGNWPYRAGSQYYYWNGRNVYPSYINKFFTQDLPICWGKITSKDVFGRRSVSSRQWIQFLKQNGFTRYLQPKTNNVEYVLIPATENCTSDIPKQWFFDIIL